MQNLENQEEREFLLSESVRQLKDDFIANNSRQYLLELAVAALESDDNATLIKRAERSAPISHFKWLIDMIEALQIDIQRAKEVNEAKLKRA